MSVLIKGMVMPYGCANCSYMGGAVYDSKGMAHYFCNVDVEGIRGTEVTNEVIAMYLGVEFSFPDFCPLVEVKEPHGRLIDADKLKSRLVLDNDSNELQRISADILKWIDIQETVIEGSET